MYIFQISIANKFAFPRDLCRWQQNKLANKDCLMYFVNVDAPYFQTYIHSSANTLKGNLFGRNFNEYVIRGNTVLS